MNHVYSVNKMKVKLHLPFHKLLRCMGERECSSTHFNIGTGWRYVESCPHRRGYLLRNGPVSVK